MRKFCLILSLLLCALLPLPALAESTELLENGDFYTLGEHGLPEGWFTESWYADISGITAGEFDGFNTVRIENPTENDARLCYTLSVEENSYYEISCYVRTVDVQGGAGANVSVVGSLASSAAVTGTTADWQRISLLGKTGEGQNLLTVCVRLGGYGALARGIAYFRDMSVVAAERSGGAADFSSASSGSTNEAEDITDGTLPYFGPILIACAFAALLSVLFQRRGIENGGLLQGAEDRAKNRSLLWILLLSALLLRIILSLIFYGHSTDITCFMAWANALARDGLSGFYTSGMFADYPPGYMYVLYIMGSIARLLGLSYGSGGYALLIKMPGILADVLAAYVIYRMAEKRLNGRIGLLLAAAVAFSPVMAFISGGWGQIDQILALLLLAVIFLFTEERLELAGLVYGLAILAKPQALMVGPLLAAAYFAWLYENRSLRSFVRIFVSVALAVAAIFLLSLPFKGNQEGLWVLDKLLGTATSYPYASIEAFNLFALLGGNWADVNSQFLFGGTYGQWGSLFIALSVAYGVVLYLRGRRRGAAYALPLSAALLLTAIFCLGQYMHERYIFPVLLLLLYSFVLSRDKRLMQVFGLMSVSLLLNVLAAFVIVDHQDGRGYQYQAVIVIGSLLNLAALGCLGHTATDMLCKGRLRPGFEGARKSSHNPALPLEPLAEEDGRARFTKRDRIYCSVLTALYALTALLNLGTTQAPENPWYGAVGDTVTITLEEEADLSEIWLFGGIYEGTATFTADDGSVILYEQDNGDMFRWLRLGAGDVNTGTLTLSVTSGRIWLNEIALVDGEGNFVKASASPGGEALLDEPGQVPDTPSYLNGMYFDELYHARTAYEHLKGLSPYENSHPPLGKIFIMLGIAVFGMNAFGWRIMGTLFGIAMIPIYYSFAKSLFKKENYALVAAGLFAFDFMHFTQTRIATIDVFAVFFIILMYYFMYRYYCMDFLRDGLRKTLLPLGLAGLFFGLGAASKWICIYAGAGLAVIFFTSLGQRFLEAKRAGRLGDFYKPSLLTLLWCCLFYILVPVAIYLLSYLPYVFSEEAYDLAGIWGVQEFMFSYHSGLTATHAYQSAWWAWPLDLRPVWYYVSYRVKEGMASTISAFGNPAVWWVCSAGTIAVIVRLARGRLRMDKGKFVLLVALGANYLPWVLVTRCTFAYHYFASVPTIILLTLYLVQDMEARHPARGWVKWAWLGLAVGLFALFYPVISGLPVSASYVHALEWLPSWTFLGY